jgi:putative transposase
MIEKSHPRLSVGAQCRLLSISRSSFYYAPQGETAMNLDLMLLIDKQFLDPVLRRPADDMALAERRPCREPETHPAADAPHAPDADLPETRHQQAREGAQDLPLSARRAAGGPAQPGLVRRHHLHPDAPRLPLSGCCHGLVHPQGFGLAHLEHAGGRLLRRGAERGDPQVRPTRDHEHGAWSRHRFERPCDVRAASSRPSSGPTA